MELTICDIRYPHSLIGNRAMLREFFRALWGGRRHPVSRAYLRGTLHLLRCCR